MTPVNTTNKRVKTVVPLLLKSPVSCAHPGCKEFTFWRRSTQRTQGDCLDHWVPPRTLIQEGVDAAERIVMDVFGPVGYLPTPPARPAGPPERPQRVAWTWAIAGTTRRPTVVVRAADAGPCGLCGQLHRGHYGPGGGPLCDQCEQIRKGFAS